MEYKEKKCPKCGGELQVPEGLEILTCMYCGKESKTTDLIKVSNIDLAKVKALEEEIMNILDTKEKEAVSKAKELLSEDPFNYSGNYAVAISGLPDILLQHKELMKQFKSKLYADAMYAYMEQCRIVLTCLERACLVKPENKEELLKESAEHFIKQVKEDIGKSKGVADDRKMVLALYTIPMILELKLDISETLTDYIVEEWSKAYPKNILRKGNFEQINGGFKKKGLCYITTAVCQTLHKPDDCYELVMFRNFRDHYLLEQPEGKNLIKEYYNMAPAIVENINIREDKEEIFQSIWQEYLYGCLKNIEAGNYEQCKKEYCLMVKDLQWRYRRTGGNVNE